MELEVLRKDMVAAMKAKDKVTKEAVSSLISAVKKVAIDEGCRDEIKSDLVDRVILKELKTVKEQLDTCPESREDLKAEYQARYDVIAKYAPKQMDAAEVKAYLDKQGLEYQDFGCYSNEAVDYPVYARKVGHAIQNGTCDKGILICGTGIGISITANKMEGIRAALCTDCFCAEATRLHNDANVLAMGGRVVGPGLAIKIVETFLNTPFSGEERHERRIHLIEHEGENE